MGILKILKQQDKNTRAAFAGFLKEKGLENPFRMIMGKLDRVLIYSTYLKTDAKLRAGFTRKQLQEVANNYLLAQYDLTSSSNKRPDDLTDREIATNIFMKDSIDGVVKHWDMEFEEEWKEFLESPKYEEAIRKSIDASALTKSLKLPKKAEKDVLATAVAIKIGDKKAAEKAAKPLAQKPEYVDALKIKVGHVSAMIKEFEKKI